MSMSYSQIYAHIQMDVLLYADKCGIDLILNKFYKINAYLQSCV